MPTQRERTASAAERRKHPRLPLQPFVKLVVLDELGKPLLSVTARACDVSEGGIALALAEKVEQDFRVLIRLPFPEGETTDACCEVRTCVEDSNGWFRVGCEFCRAPDGIDAAAVLDRVKA